MNLANNFRIIPVYKSIEDDLLTPIAIYKRLEHLNPTYILESAEDPKTIGRYSIIGLDTEPLFTEDQIFNLDDLKKRLGEFTGPKYDDLPPYYAGIIGYMAYNSISEFYPISLKQTANIPSYQFLFSRIVIAIDHLKHRIVIISNTDSPSKEAYEISIKQIEMIYQVISKNAVQTTQPLGNLPSLHFHSNFEKDNYMDAVSKAKEYILAGDIFQVVLSQKFTANGKIDGFELYRELRKQNPAPYLSYIKFPEFQILCSSPEMLVMMDLEKVETAPIAGTRAVKNDGQDERRAHELMDDEKDNAEHLMLVDLGRNDIGKICKPGSVIVDEFAQVKQYSKVMHLVSRVTGKPKEDVTPVDALKATFPAGTVSGAPKLRAMEIIDELEPDSRDLYAGSVVLLGQYGQLSSCIAIRTIQLRDDQIILQAGGGIVHDSVPEHEYLEILNKSRALFSAVENAYKGDVQYDFDYR
jgi:anthranilate synthase component 1